MLFVERALLVRLAASINKIHAREEKSGSDKRAEFSPLSPLTPLSIVMPGMANADPLAGFLGNDASEGSSQQAIESSSAPKTESKRQQKLAKKPKRVMIRG
jgi:hypothetical protein